MTSNTQSRWHVLFEDITQKGIAYFITSRIKKHYFTRKLWYLFRKPFVLIQGKKLFINKMDTVVSETLLTTGAWEPMVSKYFVKCTNKAKTIVDIGGNLGYFTLLAAMKSSAESQIFVFEPDTENFKLLKKTVLENQLTSVVCENIAIGEKSGKLQLYQAKHNLGDHRSYNSGDNRSHTTVMVISLDDYFFDTNKQIDVLKIDIQGYEVQALLGARKLLKQKRIKIIFSELWPMGLQLAGNSWQEYINLLQSNGFKLWGINEELRMVTPFVRKNLEIKLKDDVMYGTNILAVIAD